MSENGQTAWRMAGDEVGNCNCDWGCPCQFNSLPTGGSCRAMVAFDTRDGHFGDTSLDGVRFAMLFSFPGPIHEGGGSRLVVVDETAAPEQREAIEELCTGSHGGPYLEIFASVISDDRPAVAAPIQIDVDREARRGSVRVGDLAEARIEPIRNPVTGDEHRVRIDLPNGFEYKQAEIGNTVEARISAGDPLDFELASSYAQLNAFDWSNA